jgi:drug/metabolite transporter (DMT)-like permease
LNTGDLVVLASAFIFGVFIVCMDIFSKGEDPIQLSFVQIVSTAAIAAACVPFESARCTLSWGDGALVLLMAFFATVVTTYTQTRYQKETTPTRAVIIYTIEPVIAATLAYFALGEVLGVSEVFGAFLIILGILISELSDQVSDLFKRAEGHAE